MPTEIRVPQLPESVNDATIAVWVKKIGEFIEEDDTLLELETDKVILEVPAPSRGVLTQIHAEQGAIVYSSDLLGLIASEEEKEEELTTLDQPSLDELKNKVDTETTQAPAVKKKVEASEERAVQIEALEEAIKQTEHHSQDVIEANIPPIASPSIRKSMLENDIASSDITGSGKHGMIVKEDVAQHLEQKKTPEPEKVEEQAIEEIQQQHNNNNPKNKKLNLQQ